MKVRLAAAFAVVLFATLARADSINIPLGLWLSPMEAPRPPSELLLLQPRK